MQASQAVQVVKNPSACQCRRQEKLGFDPWVGKIPGAGNGNPLQYSCLESLIDRGAWESVVHGVTESGITEHTCAHRMQP